VVCPETQPIGHRRRPHGQAGAQRRQRGGGERDDAIFAAFPLLNPQGVLLLIHIPQAAPGDFAATEAAPQHHSTQGTIHRVGDPGTQGADLVLGAGRGQRTAPPQARAGFDGIARETLRFHHEIVKKMLEGIEATVDRGGRELRLALPLDERRDVAPGYHPRGFGERRKDQAQIPAIMLDRVRRIGAGVQRHRTVLEGGGCHASLPLRACRGVICAMACSYCCVLVVS